MSQFQRVDFATAKCGCGHTVGESTHKTALGRFDGREWLRCALAARTRELEEAQVRIAELESEASNANVDVRVKAAEDALL